MSKLSVEEQIIAIAEVEVREIEKAAREEREPELLSNNTNLGLRDIILGFPKEES